MSLRRRLRSSVAVIPTEFYTSCIEDPTLSGGNEEDVGQAWYACRSRFLLSELIDVSKRRVRIGMVHASASVTDSDTDLKLPIKAEVDIIGSDFKLKGGN